MQVSVKLLTTYRNRLPEGTVGNTCVIEVPENSQIEDLMEQFEIPMDSTSVILVNGHSPEEGQQLKEGDEVCVYSAMAGG